MTQHTNPGRYRSSVQAHLRLGWTGKRCEEDEDECSQTPCQNAAICVNTPGAFACACEFGFTGPLCEENLVLCKPNPCKNDALCVMEEHNATCYCVPDYHGPQCQKQYNDCLPYAPSLYLIASHPIQRQDIE
ncbi:Protein eyes shut [Portunus trituberculatus]|uniref:Protein eyes shut n=1 Tax=Portunus trituberculatus TaxID=210409 RepID=A0A5B7GDT5_PORTR|nr:Protein eyes shut [Portunus trituberculatus]